jgi:hypothetical protein
LPNEIPRKTKSPVRTSIAANAEKEGLFGPDGVGVGIPERARAFSDAKRGVRFIGSELDGDSLLNEVNQISLETVGEGGLDEKQEKSGIETSTSGAEVGFP